MLIHPKATPQQLQRTPPAVLLNFQFAVNDPQASIAPVISVGPNILVNTDIDSPQGEATIAVAPWNPNALIGGAMASLRSASTVTGAQNAVYVSTDGGATWSGRLLAAADALNGAGDPQVAAACTTGAFLATGFGPVVATSRDMGATWSQTVRLGRQTAFPKHDALLSDHPQLVVDCSGDRFHGMAYLAAGYGPLAFWRSSDDGHTWDGPTEFQAALDGIGQSIPSPPLVLSDGTIVIPETSWQKSGQGIFDRDTVWITMSSDGGRTFSLRKRVHDIVREKSHAANHLALPNNPYFAVDASPLHRDRIYLASSSDDVQPGRIFVKFSDDRGETWSQPVLVDSNGPIGSSQWMPTIAVNKDGIVGIRWFDNRNAKAAHSKDPNFRDEYFSASIDGGMTFLPAVRVSSASSSPARNQNFWQISVMGNSHVLSDEKDFEAMEYQNGGHYEGLSVDAHGTFHDFWADARPDSWSQIYTAAIEVGSSLIPDSVQRTSIPSTYFEVVYGAPKIDQNAVIEIPVSVRNRSNASLYGPFQLTITQTWRDQPTFASVRPPLKRAPMMRKMSVLRLTSILSDGVLLPGQGTAPALWRIPTT